MALMGIREYGRHRGVSHVAVLKAVRAGRIRQDRDGRIDSDRADRDWLRNTHPAAVRGIRPDERADGGYAAARTAREYCLARLAKLEYEQRVAKLVDANEVRVAKAELVRVFSDHILRVPDRVTPRIAGVMDAHQVHAILTAEIRRALEEFADWCLSESSPCLSARPE